MPTISLIAPDILLNDRLGIAELANSQMCTKGMLLLLSASKDGGIQLTKSGFLHRKFVSWAAHEFCWPGYEAEKLYEVNKVLDEQDFPPLGAMHDLMLLARLVRHRKGSAVITNTGKSMLGEFGRLQVTLFETYFSAFGFGWHERFPSEMAPIDYRHCLGVIANRLDAWTLFAEFADWCLPVDALTTYRISPIADACWILMSRLVRPMIWLGLMEEEPHPFLSRIEERRVRKTQLFGQFLRFGLVGELNNSVH